jgi:hypothetical protein
MNSELYQDLRELAVMTHKRNIGENGIKNMMNIFRLELLKSKTKEETSFLLKKLENIIRNGDKTFKPLRPSMQEYNEMLKKKYFKE